MFRPHASIVSALSGVVAKGMQAMPACVTLPLIGPDVQISRIRPTDSLLLQSIRKELKTVKTLQVDQPIVLQAFVEALDRGRHEGY